MLPKSSTNEFSVPLAANNNSMEEEQRPPLSEDEKGEDTSFSREYKEFSWETITVEDIVESVLPVNTFAGPAVNVENDRGDTKPGGRNKWKAAFTKSAMHAEDRMEASLQPYGVQLTTIPHRVEAELVAIRRKDPSIASQFPPIKGHRWAVNQTGEKTTPVYYYCRRCLQLKGIAADNPDSTKINLAMVAAGKFSRSHACDEGEAQAVLTITRLFPHDRSCSSMDADMQPTSYLDKNHFGSGAQMVDFPCEIIGTSLGPLVDLISGYSPQEGNLPIGDQIFPDTSPQAMVRTGYQMTYPFDRRFYEHLPSLNPFFGDVLDKDEYRRDMIRLWYWFAGKFSVSAQMHHVQFVPFRTHVGSLVYPSWGESSTAGDNNKTLPHLRLNGISALWGGHQVGPSPVDQLIHTDIPTKEVTELIDGESMVVDYEVSSNPALRGLFKPGSIMVPLQDSRSLVSITACEKETDSVPKGRMVFFTGDFAHAGKTYPADDPSWHMALHVYADSVYHKRPPGDKVGMTVEANVLYGSEHAVYLHPHTVVQMDTVVERIVAGMDEAKVHRTQMSRKKHKK